jgi:hypothetical protein
MLRGKTDTFEATLTEGIETLTQLNHLYESSTDTRQICLLGHEAMETLMHGVLQYYERPIPQSRDLTVLNDAMMMVLPGWRADILELDLLTNNALQARLGEEPVSTTLAEESYLICGHLAEKLTNRLEQELEGR